MDVMKHEAFRITYDGESLRSHEIDVRLLAPALLAVGDLLDNANRILNDSRAKVSVNVKGSLKTGSVNIDFAVVQGFASHAVDFLTGKEVAAAITLMAFLGISAKDGVNSVIKAIKWIRGRAIKKIETLEGKATIYIDEESLEIELEVLELLRDYDLRKSLEAMLEPLQYDGIDVFAIGTDTEIVERIRKSEVIWFKSPPPAIQEMGSRTYDTSLQIERIEFSEENKWRFFDGSASFYAVIADPVFLNQIANNEASFSRGDLLIVTIEANQRLDGDRLKTEYVIKEVHEHKRGMRQVNLEL